METKHEDTHINESILSEEILEGSADRDEKTFW